MNTALMRERITKPSLRSKARLTGVVYLLYFVTAIFGESLMRGLIVSGDATATANNLLTHESSFRWGLGVGLIGTACYIVLTGLFYHMFKPVDKRISLIAAFFSLVGCAIQAFSSVFQVAPFVVLGSNPYLRVFNTEQLQALALMLLQLHTEAAIISIVFFGLYCVVIGYLIMRSTFLPRFLGVLMALGGLTWLTFLSPPLGNALIPYNEILGGLAEVLLMLWLLVIGVHGERWNEQASVARIKE